MSTDLAKKVTNQTIQYTSTEHFRIIDEVMQLMPPREVWRPEFDALLASIREMGILNPIVAVHSDDYLWIVDGAMRFMAARKLGIPDVAFVLAPYRHDDPAVVDLAARLNWSHRHLSAFEKVWVIGNHYLSDKKRHGSLPGNQKASKSGPKTEWSNDHSVLGAAEGASQKTETRLAELYHVGQRTIRRYSDMARVCRSIIRIMAEHLSLSEEQARIRFFDLWKDMENGKQINLRFLRMIADRLVEYQVIDDPDPAIRKAWLGYAAAVDSYPKDSIARRYALPNLATDGLIEAIVSEVNKHMPSKKVLEHLNVQPEPQEPKPKVAPAEGEYIKAGISGLSTETTRERPGYQFEIPPMPEDPPVVALIQERSQLLRKGITDMQKHLDDLLTAYVPQLTRLADDLVHLMQEHWQEDFNTFNRDSRPDWEEIAQFYRLMSIKKGIFVDTLESDRDAIHLLWVRMEKLAELAGTGMPEVTKGLF